MKKLFALLTFLILFTAITCENEPIDDGIETIETNMSCEQAVLNTAEAALAFLEIDEGNYQQLCIAYKEALEAQILACGDPDGSIQQGIDALGDCTDPSTFTDCEAAENAANLAEINFSNANDDNYETLCVIYRSALEEQIFECGDEDGSLQAMIDELGDCSNDPDPVSDSEIRFSAGTAPIVFDIITVVEAGNFLEVTGESSANGASSYRIYFEVEQNATGVDIINSTFEVTLTSTFFPNTDGFDDFTSNITTNEAGELLGTFGGIVTNADGGDLSLTSGVIEVYY
ncbi:hypothetical protein RM697_03265 [Ichthyenterobacterium sp. W332]|uniref:Uncharacterized protein n=1 Tax=Microcosmobacter mediterraneus TaxID=3075607 RepID=A0ABU2YHK6_9FLAO|nr:hypothetical protein [Ichthyenterobacterium sp. W332]MDT0557648.1 hypothetical protein [Ichthyenterobacterium sp. W332]